MDIGIDWREYARLLRRPITHCGYGRDAVIDR